MDDLEHWAEMVPPAADSARVAKEARELQLKTALRSVVDLIAERRAQGHNDAPIRKLSVQGQHLEDLIKVLEHRGYNVTVLSTTHGATNTADLHIEWRDLSPASYATCGLTTIYGRTCPNPSGPCDLPKGHPGRCEAGTSRLPRCGESYEYFEHRTACKGICGLPQGHQHPHYSIGELNGPPGPARN